jgi:type IV secretory pathway TrbD component
MADDDDDDVIYTPIHRSLMRQDLVFGCERTPVIFIVAASFVLIVILQKVATILLGVALPLFGIPILRYLAARDPNMTRVFLRHFSYPDSMNAHPTLGRPPLGFRAQQRIKRDTA